MMKYHLKWIFFDGIFLVLNSYLKLIKMKNVLKLLKWVGIVLIVLVVGLFTFVQLSWDKTFDAPYPNITASKDSAVIARGKYLAFGPAHCSTCHVPMNKVMDVENGEVIPLSGGWELSIPPGTFRAPNLTPDMETGIGKKTDGEIARVLRHMVSSDNKFVFPFMPFTELSDDDVTAIISFLRSQPAVKNEVKKSELSFMGKALSAFGMLKPEGTKGTPPKSVTMDTTAEYGKYMANYVANCVGCHTNRDLKTGAFIGEPFAGGLLFVPDPFSEGRSFVTPNLTPHEETGIMTGWTEDVFVTRLKSGKIHKGSPMAWGAFSRINEMEVRAIYRYLKTLEPIDNKIAKIVFEPGEALPN
jgi:mono/diheme cytochrome c family protein